MQSRSTVVLIEPIYSRHDHARVNAALIKMVAEAYPEDRILFIGYPGHIQFVQDQLAYHDPGTIEQVIWHPVTRMHRDLPRNIMLTTRYYNPRACVLCGATGQLLLMFKGLGLCVRRMPPVLAIVHGPQLNELVYPEQPKHRAMRLAFGMPVLPWLRVIVYGESIRRELLTMMPQASRMVDVFDIPVLLKDQHAPAPDDELSFGFFGHATRSKGIETFYQLATQIKQDYPQIVFKSIGAHSPYHPLPEEYYTAFDISREPLSSEAYMQRGQSVTYAVTCSPYDWYRLRANASFLDTLQCGKPGIHLRNPYIEMWFERMGNIGYLCDSIAEMDAIMRDIIAGNRRDEYAQQQETILQKRYMLSPEHIAHQFQTIVGAYWL